MIIQLRNFLILFFLIISQSGCYLSLLDKPIQKNVSKLKQRYAVNLSTEWTEQQADALLVIFDSIYQSAEDPNPKIKPSVWKLSDEELHDDVEIKSINNLQHVTVNRHIFSEEDSQQVIDSNRRFFRVVAHFITGGWTDVQAVSHILQNSTDRYTLELVLKEMYGLSIVQKGTPESEKIAQKLRKYVGEINVTLFTDEELIMLMSVYERFPIGLYKIPRMKYLLRTDFTGYAGSAWIIADCVEYTARTFQGKNNNEFKRIILHEKAHFLWEYALNGKLRKAWWELGGWTKDSKNKNQWLTTKSKNEFVTSYASAKNPNEDWAESVAFYLFKPDKLQACSQAKYDFIESVMQQYMGVGVQFKRLQNLNK